ncbi:MAG: hypothetical protein ACM3QV_00320 [Caulobacteraceae bacterium]
MDISHNRYKFHILSVLLVPAIITPLLAACIVNGGIPDMAWNRTYDGDYYDYGSFVQQTGDGGYIITGGVSPVYKGDRNVLLIKTDSEGNPEWQKSFGGDSFDYGYFVQCIDDVGYIIAGTTDSYGNGSGDVFLVRTDADGNMQWNRTYGGDRMDEGISLVQSGDGGYIVAGFTESFGNRGRDIYLVRTDVAGNTMWERTYGTSRNESAISIQPATDGGYIISGYAEDEDGKAKACLMKIDDRGDVRWEKQYDSPYDSYAYSVQQTGDGGFVVSGYTYIRPGISDMLLIRTDADGNVMWTKSIGDNTGRKGYMAYPTDDGGYIAIGIINYNPSGAYDGYLAHIDPNGDLLWEKVFGGDKDEFIRTGIITNDGSLVVTGSIGEANDVETWDVYLAKFNASTAR